ncbi:MAG: shikimate kinase [Oscillatoriales cyanobacterium C42_A2020_001]|nr:shikimate kinase [Leptolyngbyaceae cyanobacterium C42_A2020_001]
MKKTLYILIGPKGAGKTYIGSRVDANTSIQFLRVEPIWLKLAPNEEGWQRVEYEIDQMFEQHDQIMIESLGAGEGFNQMYASLKQKYEVKLIKVSTDLDECLRRVKTRDSSNHIPVSDEKVEEYNRIAASIEHQWDAVIDNNNLATDQEILSVIQSLPS